MWLLFLGVTSEIFTVFADKSLFINCGGKEGEFEGNDYVGDLELDGISNFDLRNEGPEAETLSRLLIDAEGP